MKTAEEIRDFLSKSIEGLRETFDKLIGEKTQGIKDKIAEEFTIKIADLEAQAKTTGEWLADLQKKSAQGSIHRTSLQGGDNVLAAIPETKRHIVNRCALHSVPGAKEHVRFKFFAHDPVLKAAACMWFQNRLLELRSPAKFMAERAEEQKKLSAALSFTKDALEEGTANLGQELVPTVVEGEILRLIEDNGVMRPLVRTVPMTTLTHAWPTRSGAVTAALIAESGTITDSIPASLFSQESLTAKMFAAFATVSMQLMQDNIVGLGDYLAMEFGEQIARLEDQQALEGTGAGINFTGVDAASGINAVGSATAADGDQLQFSILVDMIYAAAEQSSRVNGRFFMHPRSVGNIMQGVVGSGNPYVWPGTSVTGAAPLTFQGYPISASSVIRIDRTSGTFTDLTQVYFGPPQTIIFGDLLGFQFDLNPWSKFQTAQIDVRGIKRTGILVGVPGAWTEYQKVKSGAME